ncbi:unnamed protein product [Trichobilharzia szidati]|nr:unnamed protein product [Trichobilharzia szidati]
MSSRYFKNPYRDVLSETEPLLLNPSYALQKAVTCIRMCIENTGLTPRTFDGCLYTGYIGVAWAALYISQHEVPLEIRKYLLEKSTHFVDSALMHSNDDMISKHSRSKENLLSFLLGQAGIWLTAITMYQHSGDIEKRDSFIRKYAELADHYKPPVIFQQGSDEIFIGRAGYLLGIATLRQMTKQVIVPNAKIYDICNAIINSGQAYSSSHRSPCPLMYAYYDTEYLGAGHGLIGILFSLMLFPGYMKSKPDAEKLICDSLFYLMQITPSETGNLPSATDEIGRNTKSLEPNVLVHWCHGATGAVFAYARAYILWRDERFLAECRRCANVVWERGLLKKGPGICHGVAGGGYVFLLLYRLTGETVYLHRATAFAHFMESDAFRTARCPDCPYSLFEGLAGTACFYADLHNPSKSAFPFMDPFWDVEGYVSLSQASTSS